MTHLIGQQAAGDTASYEHAAAGVTVDLSLQPQDYPGGGADTLTDIANLTGSQFNDVLTGDAATTSCSVTAATIPLCSMTRAGRHRPRHHWRFHVGAGPYRAGLRRVRSERSERFQRLGSAGHVTTVGNATSSSSTSIWTARIRSCCRTLAFAGLHANDFILPPPLLTDTGYVLRGRQPEQSAYARFGTSNVILPPGRDTQAA